MATLGAGALATALGVGAAGVAGVPLASTGVSDSPEPEAGAAGAAAAEESVLEESEAPALTKAALISILTSVACYFFFGCHDNATVKQKDTISLLAKWHCGRCGLQLHTSHIVQATWWTWTVMGQRQSLWAGLMTPLPWYPHWCQPACRLSQDSQQL